MEPLGDVSSSSSRLKTRAGEGQEEWLGGGCTRSRRNEWSRGRGGCVEGRSTRRSPRQDGCNGKRAQWVGFGGKGKGKGSCVCGGRCPWPPTTWRSDYASSNMRGLRRQGKERKSNVDEGTRDSPAFQCRRGGDVEVRCRAWRERARARMCTSDSSRCVHLR